MKKLGLFLLAVLLFTSCVHVETEEEKEVLPVTDGVFIHITQGYDDAHRVLMPLQMATMMATDKDVLLYLDIDAVNFLIKGADDITHENFESAHTYLAKLIDMNVGIYACPSCLEVAGYTPDNLMVGVETANKERFFDFTEGRIITLDY
jgi:predicted peroxiredoxin